MSIAGIWEGTLDGTSWGKLLAKLNQKTSNLEGFAQIIDVENGTYNFDVEGHIDGNAFRLYLSSGQYNIYQYPGTLEAWGNVINNEVIEGEWKSTLGTYGTFQAERQAPKNQSTEALVKQSSEMNAAFIIMAFGQHQQGTLPIVDILRAIQRGCESAGVNARRADEVEYSGSITALILEEIRRHRFLISDVTHERPNVYYEVGYAHGLGKEVILTAQQGTKIHFDIAGYNVILYTSGTELEERIGKRLQARMTKEERGKAT